MIDQRSVTDGFLITIGSWLVNAAALLTIVTCVWYPPEYEDEDRQTEATALFYCLIAQHLIFGGFKYYTLYCGSEFEKWSTLLVIFQLILMCYILKDWVFYVDTDKQMTTRIEKGDEVWIVQEKRAQQSKFEFWLLIEAALLASSIIGAMFFLFCIKCTQMKIGVRRQKQAERAYGDFVGAQILMIDFTNSLSSIFMISLVVISTERLGIESEYVDYSHVKAPYIVLAVLTFIQVLCFYISLFVTRGNETSRMCFIKYAPQILINLFRFAVLIMPWVVSICSIIGLILSGEEHVVFLPFFVYVLFIEIGIFVDGFIFISVKIEENHKDKALKDQPGWIYIREHQLLEAAETFLAEDLERDSRAVDGQAADRQQIEDQNGPRQPTTPQEQLRKDLKAFYEAQQNPEQAENTQMRGPPQANEEETEYDAALRLIKTIVKPYTKVERSRKNGPLRIGSHVALREDLFGVAFLSQMKIEAVTGKKAPSQSDPDEPNLKDKELKRWLENFEGERQTIAGRLIFLISCQSFLVFMLAFEQINDSELSEAYGENPTSWYLVICRFFCGIFLHIILNSEFVQGLKLMRYSLNHTWKFTNWANAYMVGFAQAMMVLSVESVNLVILLTNPNVMETVMNFLALVIIADFDDYMFIVVKDSPLGWLIVDGFYDFAYLEGQTNKRELEDITLVETTSSFLSRFKIKGNKLYKESELRAPENLEPERPTNDDRFEGEVQRNLAPALISEDAPALTGRQLLPRARDCVVAPGDVSLQLNEMEDQNDRRQTEPVATEQSMMSQRNQPVETMPTEQNLPNQPVEPVPTQENQPGDQQREVAWDNLKPDYIYIPFSGRKCPQQFCLVLYQLLRGFHQIFWFYFAPFFVIFVSYALPYYLGDGVVSQPYNFPPEEDRVRLYETTSFSSKPTAPLFVTFASDSQV